MEFIARKNSLDSENLENDMSFAGCDKRELFIERRAVSGSVQIVERLINRDSRKVKITTKVFLR